MNSTLLKMELAIETCAQLTIQLNWPVLNQILADLIYSIAHITTIVSIQKKENQKQANRLMLSYSIRRITILV